MSNAIINVLREDEEEEERERDFCIGFRCGDISPV